MTPWKWVNILLGTMAALMFVAIVIAILDVINQHL